MIIPGFRFAGVAAGIKASGNPDVALLCAGEPVPTAAVFTQNRVKAAPVLLSQRRMTTGLSRGVVVNSGNANAMTGKQGAQDAVAMTRLCARLVGGKPTEYLVASTGVIGVPLPMPKVERGIKAAAAALSEDGFDAFSRAILTTDRWVKTHVVKTRVGKTQVTVAGCAKGAGMIAPNMATTLGFVVTDADCHQGWLQRTLTAAIDRTFNSVTVDGDTSTNDSVYLFASGKSGSRTVARSDADGRRMAEAIETVLGVLARELVRDGEGATRLVRVDVRGGKTPEEARAVAARIANSPLVKTAIHGADPNWGRIAGAAGAAGAAFDPEKIRIKIGQVQVYPPTPGAHERARKIMATRAEYDLLVDLQAGKADATFYMCDLGPDYVTFNSGYTT